MKKSYYFNAFVSFCLVALLHTIAIAQLSKPSTNPEGLSPSLSNNLNALLESNPGITITGAVQSLHVLLWKKTCKTTNDASYKRVYSTLEEMFKVSNLHPDKAISETVEGFRLVVTRVNDFIFFKVQNVDSASPDIIRALHKHLVYCDVYFGVRILEAHDSMTQRED